jgi:hypothetical protein
VIFGDPGYLDQNGSRPRGVREGLDWSECVPAWPLPRVFAMKIFFLLTNLDCCTTAGTKLTNPIENVPVFAGTKLTNPIENVSPRSSGVISFLVTRFRKLL